MQAILQRIVTIACLLLATLALVFSHFKGRTGIGILFALGLISGYAAVLALEFLTMTVVQRNDATPKPRASQVLHAWWCEVWAALRVFCWQQPFHSNRWPDHLPASSTGRRGVLLVHGFACNRGVWNRWLARFLGQGTPFIAVNLEPLFASIDAYAPIIDTAVHRLRKATGQAPIIVAHSMGGLAVRCWLAATKHDELAIQVITLGTPHHGTWLARWATAINGRQMRQGSAWLQGLVKRETRATAASYCCYYSNCDNIVFPATTAMLPNADNRLLAGVAHVQMVDNPEPWAEVQRRLDLAD